MDGEGLHVGMLCKFSTDDLPVVRPGPLGAGGRVDGDEAVVGLDVMLEGCSLIVAGEGLVVAVGKDEGGVLAQVGVSEDFG